MNTLHTYCPGAALAIFLTLSGAATIAAEAAAPLEGFPPVVELPSAAVSGGLSLTPCRYRIEADRRDYAADCGTLVVPENRAKQDGRLIALPLVRIRAVGGSPAEPVFWFQGGPGSSNVVNVVTDGLLERHDLVMVGYRGLDGDVKLECPEIAESIASASGPALGPEARAVYAAGAARCATRLTRAGIDLAAYSMTATIDDMEAARIALGYGPIDLLGKSFGTRLELIYLWRYPQSLHRAVLVAVNPPGHFLWDPHVTDELLGRYGELCARDAHCRSRTQDLATTLRRVSADMPRSWLGIPIDADFVKLMTFFALMESVRSGDAPVPVYGPGALDVWLDAADGDASGMALLSLVRRPIWPRLIGHWGHFLAMGGSTLDYYDPRRDYARELMPAGAVLGAPASLFNWSMTQGWPPSPARFEYNEVLPSDVETLLVSGTLDFSTPMRFARDELLPRLSRGHQVVLREFGHTATFWHSQDAARARLLNRFLDEGVVDSSAYVYQPPDFRVERGWGTLARLLLAAAIVMLFVVVALGFWLVRLLRRRLRAGPIVG